MVSNVKTELECSSNRLELPKVTCVSSEYVSREKDDLKYLNQFEGAEVEAMETTGFAQAASLMNVPCLNFGLLVIIGESVIIASGNGICVKSS